MDDSSNPTLSEDREKLFLSAAEMGWFHALDFGEYQSPGRNFKPRVPANRTLFGIMDMLSHVELDGLHCLDIGTVDGLIAFNMKMRNAARVVGTDIPKKGRATFDVSRKLLGLDVEMFGDTAFDNILEKVEEHSFDVVVCSGVMYHMLNPFDAILKSRRLLKRNGLFLFQTLHRPDDQTATLDLNPVSGASKQLDIFWVPSRPAVMGMLALGGFNVLAVRTGTKHQFLSVIAQNVPVEEITDAPDLILKQHARGISYREFKRVLPDEPSRAAYTGPRDEVVIDDLKFQPDFPPHPTIPKPLIGDSIASGTKSLKTISLDG